MSEYDPTDDAVKSYYAAIEAKRLRGDAERLPPIKARRMTEANRFYGDPVEKFRAMANAAHPSDTIDGAHFRMWCAIAADEIEAAQGKRTKAVAWRWRRRGREDWHLTDYLNPGTDFDVFEIQKLGLLPSSGEAE